MQIRKSLDFNDVATFARFGARGTMEFYASQARYWFSKDPNATMAQHKVARRLCHRIHKSDTVHTVSVHRKEPQHG